MESPNTVSRIRASDCLDIPQKCETASASVYQGFQLWGGEFGVARAFDAHVVAARLLGLMQQLVAAPNRVLDDLALAGRRRDRGSW